MYRIIKWKIGTARKSLQGHEKFVNKFVVYQMFQYHVSIKMIGVLLCFEVFESKYWGKSV